MNLLIFISYGFVDNETVAGSYLQEWYIPIDDQEALELSTGAVLADAVTDSSVGWRLAMDTLSWIPDTTQPFIYTTWISHST